MQSTEGRTVSSMALELGGHETQKVRLVENYSGGN